MRQSLKTKYKDIIIPKMISNIFNNKELPIYAKGLNSREWIYVSDHCEALFRLYLQGRNGESYNVGTGKNLRNIDLVKQIINVCKNLKIEIGNKPGSMNLLFGDLFREFGG